jgi:hypothetical protein
LGFGNTEGCGGASPSLDELDVAMPAANAGSDFKKASPAPANPTILMKSRREKFLEEGSTIRSIGTNRFSSPLWFNPVDDLFTFIPLCHK